MELWLYWPLDDANYTPEIFGRFSSARYRDPPWEDLPERSTRVDRGSTGGV